MRLFGHRFYFVGGVSLFSLLSAGLVAGPFSRANSTTLVSIRTEHSMFRADESLSNERVASLSTRASQPIPVATPSAIVIAAAPATAAFNSPEIPTQTCTPVVIFSQNFDGV